jgi:hypothetical protein
MPNMCGGNQFDEDYAPHLYYKGKFVGEEKAKQLEAKDEERKEERRRAMLMEMGLDDFDFEANNYITTNESDLKIKKEGFKLGIISREGYIEITYQIGLNPHESPVLKQVELAGELARKLRDNGCKQLIELPPRKRVIQRLEEMAKYSEQISEKFKNE